MNFYKRFVADIQVKTGHLTPAEFGIYDRLLDHYYATESALPSFERCCGIARAMSKADKEATARVLAEFFTAEEGGLYSQRRADEMIAEAQPKIEAARLNGKSGGRPRKNPKPANEKPTGFIPETQQAENAKASQNQNQKETKSSSKILGKWNPPDWIPAKEWEDFEELRRSMRSVPFTDAARDGVVRELKKFAAKGHDPAQLLSHAVTNGHRTVYEPKLGSFNGTHVNKQEALEASNKAVGDRWLAEQEQADATH